MEVYRKITEVITAPPSAVALGFFDGLHAGHTQLLQQTIEHAKQRRLSSAVFTFADHPKNIMSGSLAVPRLMTEEQKLARLEALGIDRVYNFDFADGFHTMPPETFAEDLLKSAFNVEAAFCGFNFRFGAEAAGTPETLKTLGAALGFETQILNPVYIADKLVSSSLIRRSINEGDAETAALLLGREYTLTGTVTKGRSLGRAFGFPTANFPPAPDLALPAKGVYITETLAENRTYPSITNVGTAPTVSDISPPEQLSMVRIETHLIDVSDINLEQKTITIAFKKMLRPEIRFENSEALIEQIAKDTETARRFFA